MPSADFCYPSQLERGRRDPVPHSPDCIKVLRLSKKEEQILVLVLYAGLV